MYTNPVTRLNQPLPTISQTHQHLSSSDTCLKSRFGNVENQCSIDKMNKGRIEKKQFYTPNLQKGKGKSQQTLSSRQRVSNGEISISSMNISSESNEGKEERGGRGERMRKRESIDENINIMEGTSRKKWRQREDHPHNQIYFPQQNQQKKSYRKSQIKRVSNVPFRKSHSLIEEKIVVLINKLQMEKDCQRQIKSLNDKLKKLSTRELMNKYVVSGILVICRLASSSTPSYILNPLHSTFKDIEERIQNELDRIDGFSGGDVVDEVCFQISRQKLIKRVYKLLRKKGGQNLRVKSIKIVSELLESRLGKEQLVRIFNQKHV